MQNFELTVNDRELYQQVWLVGVIIFLPIVEGCPKPPVLGGTYSACSMGLPAAPIQF